MYNYEVLQWRLEKDTKEIIKTCLAYLIHQPTIKEVTRFLYGACEHYNLIQTN